MCNFYSVTTNREAIRRLFGDILDVTGNPPPMPGVYPDYPAPMVRNAPDGQRELAKARWGMPSPQNIQFEATKKRAQTLETKGNRL